MEFELRRLQASDLFFMVQIINKIGIDNIRNAINFEEIKNYFIAGMNVLLRK